jgi:hypothetical protein
MGNQAGFRMGWLAGAACLMVVTLTTTGMPADEGVGKLPKDGAWVRYFGKTRREGTTEESIIKVKYSLTGTTMENGQVCRWLEVEEVEQINGKDRTDLIKYLVPEKDLRENEKPLENLVRAWRRLDREEVQPLKFNALDGLSGEPHFYFGHWTVVFPGPRKQSAVLKEPKTVDYQNGRLEIPNALAARYVATHKSRTSNFVYTRAMDFSVWLHDDIPLGVAAWKGRMEFRQDDQVRQAGLGEYFIEDFGVDAKTGLPDHN